ncbi:MAG TPA: recombinase family protein, partial [Rubrobacteraceae bacterium]|nr:recombinase family protein [Rubrobacteraceae bacterium]
FIFFGIMSHYTNGLGIKREFEEYGTKMRSDNGRGDESPEGELTDGILDQLAKFERAKMAERSRRGKLRKAREGKVIGAHRPRYGFKINETRDGYEVDEEKMQLIRRIFRMVAEGHSFRSLAQTLEREGIPTPKGAKFWDRSFFRTCVLDDIYKPHTFGEVEEAVSPDVAARLDPANLYGLWWFNRKEMKSTQVSEPPRMAGATPRSIASGRSRKRSGSPCPCPTLAFPGR